MLQKLYAVQTDSVDPYYNLALEERLLKWLPKDSVILYLWQNAHTVVIGKNQNAWKECRTEALQADGGHLVRRSSGGGAVYHDLGNLNFTFLAHKEDYDVHRQLTVIMEACRTFGIPTEISGRNDVLACGRKFSGNAFLQTDGRCSHHGTILMNVDTAKMMKYLRPSKEKLQAKGVNSVESRVVNLIELAPDMTTEKMKTELFLAFERVYGMSAEKITEDVVGREELLKTAERYESWDWCYGKTLDFTMSFGKKFPWGEIEIQLQISHGIISDVKVYSDSLDTTIPPRLELALTDKKVSQENLKKTVMQLGFEKEVESDLLALIEAQNL